MYLHFNFFKPYFRLLTICKALTLRHRNNRHCFYWPQSKAMIILGHPFIILVNRSSSTQCKRLHNNEATRLCRFRCAAFAVFSFSLLPSFPLFLSISPYLSTYLSLYIYIFIYPSLPLSLSRFPFAASKY